MPDQSTAPAIKTLLKYMLTESGQHYFHLPITMTQRANATLFFSLSINIIKY
jgi:hypothetical protein